MPKTIKIWNNQINDFIQQIKKEPRKENNRNKRQLGRRQFRQDSPSSPTEKKDSEEEKEEDLPQKLLEALKPRKGSKFRQRQESFKSEYEVFPFLKDNSVVQHNSPLQRETERENERIKFLSHQAKYISHLVAKNTKVEEMK